MGLLSLEHGQTAYRADFALYGAAVVLLALLLLRSPPGTMLGELACVLSGAIAWTLIEYGLHRFVLHGLQPFKAWHAAHHRRPTALIGLPTLLSATLFASLVFAPAWGASNLWLASGLTLGVLIGYLAYAITHHATHHALVGRGAAFASWLGPWLGRRRRWHALHHRHLDHPVCFGVTSAFWDHLFGSRHPLDVSATGDGHRGGR